LPKLDNCCANVLKHHNFDQPMLLNPNKFTAFYNLPNWFACGSKVIYVSVVDLAKCPQTYHLIQHYLLGHFGQRHTT